MNPLEDLRKRVEEARRTLDKRGDEWAVVQNEVCEERSATNALIEAMGKELKHRKEAIDSALCYLCRLETLCDCGASFDSLAKSMHAANCPLAAALRALDQDFNDSEVKARKH